MPRHYLKLLAILNTLIVIGNSVVCSTASATTPLLFLDYGDMNDFMKLIQRYQTSSQHLFPSKEDDPGRMEEVFQNMALTVGLAVIYKYKRNKWYEITRSLQACRQRFHHDFLFRVLNLYMLKTEAIQIKI